MRSYFGLIYRIGNLWSSLTPGEEKEGYGGKDLQKRKVSSLE